jgi:cytochrome c peroxidase
MRRKPIRVLAAVAAIVIAGFAVALVSRPDTPDTAAFVDTSHGEVKLAKGEMQRVLNAANTQTSQVAEDQLVAKGRQIFRDPALFEHGETCQTCHAEGAASARLGTMVHDELLKTQHPDRDPTLPDPPTDFNGPRDPPALFDLAKTPPYFWDGHVPTLSQAVATPVFGHMAMYVPKGKDAPAGYLDCQADNNTDACVKQAGEIAAALTAYIKTLKAPQTSFDDGTMSEQALRGEKLFQGKGGCIECHGGPDFTDNLVHNTGVPQVTFTSPYGTTPATRGSNDLGAPAPPADPGCAGANPVACDVPPPATSAFINTPQLRDLANTPPYMHNGAFKNLTDLVQFYNRNSTLAPLNLTDAEVADLVAYLKSL